MPCSYSYLQEIFYKRFDDSVGITVVLKESDNKLEGSSPSKDAGIFMIYMFAEKGMFWCIMHM